eukprot:gene4692-5307_t
MSDALQELLGYQALFIIREPRYRGVPSKTKLSSSNQTEQKAMPVVVVSSVEISSDWSQVRVKLSSKTFYYGQDIGIYCQARRSSFKFIGLFKKDSAGKEVKIKADGKKIKSRRYRNGRLMKFFLLPFTLQDRGTYICKYDKGTAEKHVSPKGPVPDAPTARFMANEYHVKKGGRVTLYCATNGPFDGFYYGMWSRVHLIQDKGNYNVFIRDNGLSGNISRLVIRNVKDDARNFYCRSGNYLASAKVIAYSNRRRRVSFEDESFAANIGSYVRLICNSRGSNGNPELFKVDTKTGKQVKVEPTHTGAGLIALYKTATPADAGYYLCKNGGGTAVATVNVEVSLSSLSSGGPIQLKKGEDGIVTIKLPIENERLTGSAPLVSWSKSIKGTRKYKMIANRFGPITATSDKRYEWTKTGAGLIIRGVTDDDAGIYKIVHINGGYESLSFQVEVK